MPHCNEKIEPVQINKDMIEPLAKKIEDLLKQQLRGEEFILLEITKKCGNKVFLRSNSFEAIEIRNQITFPEKRTTLANVQNKTTASYSGSPNCELIDIGGGLIMVNKDGGPIEDCYTH